MFVISSCSEVRENVGLIAHSCVSAIPPCKKMLGAEGNVIFFQCLLWLMPKVLLYVCSHSESACCSGSCSGSAGYLEAGSDGGGILIQHVLDLNFPKDLCSSSLLLPGVLVIKRETLQQH